MSNSELESYPGEQIFGNLTDEEYNYPYDRQSSYYEQDGEDKYVFDDIPSGEAEQEFAPEEYFMFCPEEEESEEEVKRSSFDDVVAQRLSRKLSRRLSTSVPLPIKERKKTVTEGQTKGLFVHSPPSEFPDVTKATTSSYGSTFLRSTGDVEEDLNLIRSLTDSSFGTLHSFFSSFDRILSGPTVDSHRRHLTAVYKDSMIRGMEQQGLTKRGTEAKVHWNFYPTSHNYLFSIQIADRLHKTRVLSKIEDRILNSNLQKLRLPYAWPTDSVWTGHWNLLGMSGSGTYSMPHGVTYQGKMQDGMFHDSKATLIYPNQFKAINCVYENGQLLSCLFQFPDGLVYSSSDPKKWDYCRTPDRRFWSEVQKGLKPAKISQKTELDPPRTVAPNCYDTNDGFYDPQTLMLTSPNGELLRVPTCEEAIWIQRYCRKGFFEAANFRPDLFENWFNFDNDFIQLILDQQAEYRRGKITYEELQQFYADFDLLPSWSNFKKRKFSDDVEDEIFLKNVPSPRMLGEKSIRKFKGHKIHEGSHTSGRSSHSGFRTVYSKKSLTKFTEYGPLAPRSSRISFKLARDGQEFKALSHALQAHTPPSSARTRPVPQKFLEYNPVLPPPFRKASVDEAASQKPPRRCWSKGKVAQKFGDLKERLKEAEQTATLAKSLIWDIIKDITSREREKLIRRLKWAQKEPAKCVEVKRLKAVVDSTCLSLLEEMFDSIPEEEEFCDSDPNKVCDLRKLAQDKYKVLQYWGTRMFTLNLEKKESK